MELIVSVTCGENNVTPMSFKRCVGIALDIEFADLIVPGRTVMVGQVAIVVGFGVLHLEHQINFPEACGLFLSSANNL